MKNRNRMKDCCRVFWLGLLWLPSLALAQETAPAVDHSQMDHSKMGHGAANQPASSPPTGAHGNSAAAPENSPQSGDRDPHAYSNGLRFPEDRALRLGDEHLRFAFMADRLEAFETRTARGGAYEITARYGLDYNRAVLKAEGHVADGRVEEAGTELLWSHAFAPFWDAQLGVRHDSGLGRPGRNWLALGVQGLAPYWFETDVAVYIGDDGRSALRLEVEYELLLTQRLVLQPRLEASLYGKEDPEWARGTGLSETTAGLRLRYEVLREFAPYVGVEWSGKYGGTADFARAAGSEIRETRIVAGLRAWF